MTRTYSDEVGPFYTMDTVMEEAQRCLLCLDAPCSAACPAGTDPAKFIRSVRFRNLKGAAETIRENNAIGGICARVCPTERYCQQACSRCGIIDGYVPEHADKDTVTFKHRHMDGTLQIRADKIILAVGQKPDLDGLGLELKEKAGDTEGYTTADPNVFVTGDLALGDKTVVWAVRKGKEAAQMIHQSLQERGSRS